MTWTDDIDFDPVYDAAHKAVDEVAEGVPHWLITIAVNSALAALDQQITEDGKQAQ